MSGFETMNVKKPGTPGAGEIRRSARKSATTAPAHHAVAFDRLAPTELANWIEKAHSLPEVRTDLVERIKAEIADGAYETPEKIQIAAERMLEEF